MSAKSLCVLCWWAARAGIAGPAGSYSFRPGTPTGHYQRHVDSVSGVNLKANKQSMLKVGVPRYTKHGAGRSLHELPV